MGTVNFQLDGGNNTAGLRGTGNPAPNPEAVQEFRVHDQRLLGRVRPLLRPASSTSSPSRARTMFHGAAFEFFRNEKLNAPRWAPPGTRRHQGPARSQPVRRRVRRPDREGQDVLLRQLLGTAAGRDLLPQHRGGADGARARRRLLAVVAIKPQRSGDRRRRFPATSSRRRASTSRRRRFRTSTSRCRTCRTTSTKSARPDPLQHRRRRRSSSITSCRRRSPSRSATSIQTRRRHAAAVAAPATSRGSIATSSGRSTTSTSPHTWTLSPTMINQLRVTYVRQFGGAREQSDDVARRSEFEVHDPGRSDAAAAHGHRLLHRPDVDRRARRRQQLHRREGRAEHQPAASTRSSSAARSRTRRSSTTRCSTTTACSRSTAARPATPTPTSCSACRRR